MNKPLLSFLLTIVSCCFFSQTKLVDPTGTEQRLRQHITYLSSDQLEGRESGSKGESLAVAYVTKQFSELGLRPAGVNGFLQPFTFTKDISFEKSKCSLTINGKSLELNVDYVPLPYSSSGKITGQTVFVLHGLAAPKLNYDDYQDLKNLKGKIFIIDVSRPWKKGEDSSQWTALLDLRTRIDTAIAKGAAAIFLIDSDGFSSSFAQRYKKSDWSKISSTSVPVVGLESTAWKKLDVSQPLSIELTQTIQRNQETANNVIAFLDNRAENTVVIGAHMDHLGYGDEESSLYKGGKAIHNGADDNASGTAAVIELARELKKSLLNKNNYLFICFSGEEKGLLGSSYFVKNPTLQLSKANYMINMDMIGRLNKDDKLLYLYGTGTSSEWKKVIEKLSVDSLKIKQTESGIGPSDHTMFYLNNVPVLHFFTGFHADYHKPSDDADKINYQGELSVMNYILNIIAACDAKGKLNFTKTKDEVVSSRNVGRPKTTLGIIPDYAPGTGDGMKINGVTEGKPAEAAGLKAGDVIVRIGEYKVYDMQSYMDALGHFKKEDKTTVTIKRNEQEIVLPVDFNPSASAVPQKSLLNESNYRIYSVKRQKEITINEIVADMQDYDVLFYGEEHNDSVTHFLEKEIFQKLIGAYSKNVTLSMEMFDRDVQTVMNEYLNNQIREKNFKKDARVWSNYRDYRPMVELARENKLNVICANAPSRYTNLAGRMGQDALKKLSEESKNYFAPLPYDTARGKYYEKLMEMSGHSPGDTSKPKMAAMMGGFNLIVAQSLWDATMAYSIATFAKKYKKQKIFQVNGRFHSDERFAVVEQLKKYNPKLRTLVISSGSDESFPSVDWKKYEAQGDFIIITDPKVPKTYDE